MLLGELFRGSVGGAGFGGVTIHVSFVFYTVFSCA
jgi:hypothetical protein